MTSGAVPAATVGERKRWRSAALAPGRHAGQQLARQLSSAGVDVAHLAVPIAAPRARGGGDASREYAGGDDCARWGCYAAGALAELALGVRRVSSRASRVGARGGAIGRPAARSSPDACAPGEEAICETFGWRRRCRDLAGARDTARACGDQRMPWRIRAAARGPEQCKPGSKKEGV